MMGTAIRKSNEFDQGGGQDIGGKGVVEKQKYADMQQKILKIIASEEDSVSMEHLHEQMGGLDEELFRQALRRLLGQGDIEITWGRRFGIPQGEPS